MTVTSKFRLALPLYNEVGWDDDLNDNFVVIDAVLSQYVALTDIVGIWRVSTLYNVNDKVVDSADSTLWNCLISHTSASSGAMSADRVAHPTYWATAAVSVLDAVAAATTATAAAATAVAAANSVSGIGAFRNALINGDFTIWQRTYPFVGVAATAGYFADRWRSYYDGAGGATTITFFDTLAAAIINNVGITRVLTYVVASQPAGITTRYFQQFIEGVRTFAGQQVTVSFYGWVAAGTQVVPISLQQYFGTGGSPSATVSTTVGLPQLTTTPQRFSFTTTLASIVGKTLGNNSDDALVLVFAPPISGAYTLDIAGVQLELGATANMFTYRPYAQEFMLCQRYYQSVSFYGQGYQLIGGNYYVGVDFPTSMRTATPTITLRGAAANINITGPAAAANGTFANYGGQATATGSVQLSAVYDVSSEY